MKIVSVEEMRRIDLMAQEQFGIDGYDLMAAAGRAIAETADKLYAREKICIVCGKGNNAGDGFVAARVFHEMGRDVEVVCLEESSAYTGAAREAWKQLAATAVPVFDRAKLQDALEKCSVVIDALLGTGTKGAVRGKYAEVIRQINASGKTVVAADVPSGMREMSAGEDPGAIINATLTLTIGLPKTMLLLLPGSSYTGGVIVLTINFPPELLSSDEWQLNWAPSDQLTQWLPERPLDSNKGTFGHVGIIGSALSFAGATVLVARGALRTGCGLATIYTLPGANAIYKTALPEATSVILESGNDGYFDEKAAVAFERQCRQHSVLAVGPGLGTAADTKLFLQRVLEKWKGPLVLDADALNLISEDMLQLLHNREDCLITPHPGEMGRLTGKDVKDVQADRMNAARGVATSHGVHVLLKGTGTIVARPDGQVWLIPGSEPALAKGGTGDILTGIIAALYAQGVPMWQAAVLGASAHLTAGQDCARRYGSRGVLASEVADAVPLVLDSLTGKNHD